MRLAYYILTFLLLASFVTELCYDISTSFLSECIDLSMDSDDNDPSSNEEDANEEEIQEPIKTYDFLLPHVLFSHNVLSYLTDDDQRHSYLSLYPHKLFNSIPELPPELV